eukprot:TRINITY_DN15259_c0_g1_i1.p1 TRINITY_DN15259_c0_g1~~TRINITY_DN15259_c0_g1_i1.p1  ORF type:complete len:170 (-),score=37.04 TRINITY_DN15259_c0_g1_i1:2-451(-)
MFSHIAHHPQFAERVIEPVTPVHTQKLQRKPLQDVGALDTNTNTTSRVLSDAPSHLRDSNQQIGMKTPDLKRTQSPSVERMFSRMVLGASPAKRSTTPSSASNPDRLISKILQGPTTPNWSPSVRLTPRSTHSHDTIEDAVPNRKLQFM